MKMRGLAAVALFAVVLMPAVVKAAEAPTSTPQPPPLTSTQLEAILAGGLPCTQACYVERDCNCDPPVIVSCTGCRSCSQTWFGVTCDGIVYSCPPCAQ
jgi:hypothetical protein